jgi:hypothetical protein
VNGWIDLDTLAAATKIPRSTLRDWARRYGWESVRPDGRIHYHHRQVRPYAEAWLARKSEAA